MKIIGLDLSTVSSGYSVFNDDKLIESGKVVPPSSLDTMARIVYTVDKLKKIVDAHVPNKVIIEDTYYGSNYEVTKILNRLAGAVMFMCHERKEIHSIPKPASRNFVEFVKPSSARKYFGLLPASKKRHIVEAVNRKFNKEFLVKDNDEADAIITGYYGYIADHKPDEAFKKEAQKFFKTKVRGLKTPPIKGLNK